MVSFRAVIHEGERKDASLHVCATSGSRHLPSSAADPVTTPTLDTREGGEPSRSEATASSGSGRDFRADIQALRALAVVAVVLFHLWPNRVTGGYVGVDVFFVISGFLITSHLVSDTGKHGRVRAGTFWSKRAKRLLPNALLVLGTVTVAIGLIVPMNLWAQFLREVVASTFYVENWVLALDSVDYLAASNTPSPVQHFWTLSVEEQFYIALPLLLIPLVFIAKRTRTSTRTFVGVLMLAIVIIGFTYSVTFTAENPPFAFFSTLTRSWEFAVGGLIAFIPAIGSRWLGRVLAVAGIAAIAYAILEYTEATPFPGSAAAIPVLGAALVIWAGTNVDTDINRVGTWSPVAFTGRISYAIYLWHWPLIVLIPFITLTPLTTYQKLGIILTTILIAWASTDLIENPIRFSPRLLGGKRRPLTIGLVCATAMAIVVTGAGILYQQQANAAAAADKAAAAIGDRIKTEPCLGANAMINKECQPFEINDPILSTERDSACPRDDGSYCGFGPKDAATRIFAVGDSHNFELIAAYQRIAEEREWRIDIASAGACPWADIDMELDTAAQTDDCIKVKDRVNKYLAKNPPYTAIISSFSEGRAATEVVPAPGKSALETITAGLVSRWNINVARGTQMLAIRDLPHGRLDVVTCVDQYGDQANQKCSTPQDKALSPSAMAIAIDEIDNGSLIDLTDLFCRDHVCAPVIGNVLAYRDSDHMPVPYAKTLAAELGNRMAAALKTDAPVE